MRPAPEDLNVLQVNAWVYWQAIENFEGGTWWGLMQVPFHTGRYIILGKQFYCLMKYSRFIRCGSSILHSPQPKSVLIAKAAPDAARPNQTCVVIVATNALSDYDVVNFDLSKCGSSGFGDSKGHEVDSKGSEMNRKGTAMIDIHRTSASENCQKVPTPLRFKCRCGHLALQHLSSHVKLLTKDANQTNSDSE